jgi:hypothetical protein
MLHRNVGVYQATPCHSPEGSWLHCQHFTSDSFLLLQDTSQGQSVITREWNFKCLSLVILHCGKVALRSLPPQFARPLRWDSDKGLIRFYQGILCFQKVIRLHVIVVNVMTASRMPVFTNWQKLTASCADVLYGMSPKTDNKYGKQKVR